MTMQSFLMPFLMLSRRGRWFGDFPIPTAVIVLAVLLASRKLLHVPRPMILTLGLCFLSWLVVYCVLRVGRAVSVTRGGAYLLAPWTAMSLLILGGVYYLDRGGWLWYTVSGFNGAIAEYRYSDKTLSPAEFVRRNPEFALDTTDPSHHIVLPRGEYNLSHTVVLPRGTEVTIEPGTIVRMGVGCSLISYSPILARGTADQPIQFVARNHWFKWGVIGLVGAGRAVFEHVRFENARQAVVNGTSFPGGLSLIETNADIRNCQFLKMYGKDAIYVRHSHVRIINNQVQDAFKDGIDLDAASGEIRGNLLVDCDDEGIDVSDNDAVDVRRNTVRDRRGGRIAASNGLERILSANTLEFSPR